MQGTSLVPRFDLDDKILNLERKPNETVGSPGRSKFMDVFCMWEKCK